jgi:glutaredoxin
MKKILILMVTIGLLYSFYPNIFSFKTGKGAFDEQGNPITMVFTLNKCGRYCGDAFSLLKQRKIKYVEYNIDQGETNKTLWKEHSGKNNFPIVITGDEAVHGYYKHLIISGLAMNYGDKILTSSERYYIKQHFYADGSPKLVMYGASWCPYCKKMRAALQEKNIDFIEINVDKSPQEKSMVKTLEITGFPLMYYGYKRMQGPRPEDVISLL